MLDNLQLLFVWAPIINIQVILDGIFVGAVFALSAYEAQADFDFGEQAPKFTSMQVSS